MSARVERIGDATLYLGRCEDVLPTLNGVDACVTDPPYGIGKGGQKESSGAHGGRKGYEFIGWDKERPSSEVFASILRACSHHIIWGGNYFADLMPPTAGWLVWDKGQRINQSDGELAWTSRDCALRIMTKNRVALLLEGAEHPTQKPIEIMQWSILQLPTDCRTILDPFMGSGTTGVACARLGRRFIDIECHEPYFDIACRRIEQAQRQRDLFISAPVAADPQDARIRDMFAAEPE